MAEIFNPEDTTQFDPVEHGPRGLGALPPVPQAESHFRRVPAETPLEQEPRSANWRHMGRQVVENSLPTGLAL